MGLVTCVAMDVGTNKIAYELDNNSNMFNNKTGHTNYLGVIEQSFCFVILVFGTFGNFSLIVALACRWKKLKSFELLLCSLPVADFIASVFIPIEYLSKARDDQEYLTDFHTCRRF